MRLLRLTLTNFRNYQSTIWTPASRLCVIAGPNGGGKTNLLEAVSLLVPGAGLRGGRNRDYARLDGDGSWAVAARIRRGDDAISLGTGQDLTRPERRVFQLDGLRPTLAEIACGFAAVGLTPQMDRLFLEAASGRRRFLDRLVVAFEPGHAREIAAHDAAMMGRNRLLAEARDDARWLSGLEDGMARHGVAAAASRAALVTRLNRQSESAESAGFPIVRVILRDLLAERLQTETALQVEDWLRAQLAASRARDAASRSTGLGAHRSDMQLLDGQTGLDAAMASTGQQKAMLIGLILAHAGLICTRRATPPLLLLDEPMVHLDADRRTSLLAALSELPGQILATGTDTAVFAPWRGLATGWRVRSGTIERDQDFTAD